MASQGVDFSVVDAIAQNPGLPSVSAVLQRLSGTHALALAAQPITGGAPTLCGLTRQLCATVAATQPPSLLTMYDLNYLSAVETSCCGDGAAGPACLASSLAVFAQQPVGVPTTLSECHVACLRDGNPLLGCDLLCGVQPQARW